MGIKIDGEYVFNGPQNVVYEIVRDPNMLLLAIPGESSMNPVSETEYHGTIQVKIGPVNGQFTGVYFIKDDIPPQSFTMDVKGKGAAGFMEAVGYTQFIPRDDGNTLFKYQGEVNIGGKLASVGQRLLDNVIKSMLSSGMDKLNKEVEKRKE